MEYYAGIEYWNLDPATRILFLSDFTMVGLDVKIDISVSSLELFTLLQEPNHYSVKHPQGSSNSNLRESNSFLSCMFNTWNTSAML